MEAKKMALIRILQILLEHSDINHPLTHDMIAERLYNDYGIEIERKAIGRHINDLIEMFEKESVNKIAGDEIIIASDKRKGTYIEKRVFEDSELRMLIDGVLSSKYITAKHFLQLSDIVFKQYYCKKWQTQPAQCIVSGLLQQKMLSITNF